MYNFVPGALFPGFGGGVLHLQSHRKCQVRLNRAHISVPNESGGSGEKLGGEGNSKIVQRGPSSKHTACVLAVFRETLQRRLQARIFATVTNARAWKPKIAP